MGIFGWFSKNEERQVPPESLPGADTIYIDKLSNDIFSDGRSISLESAYGLPTYAACLDLISQTVSSSPIHIKVEGGNGYSVNKSHPLNTILRRVVNSDGLLSIAFYEALIKDSYNYGHGIAYIERDNQGNVVGLWRIKPNAVKIDVNDQGERIYIVGGITNQTYLLRPYQVLHIRGATVDGWNGRGALKCNSTILSLAKNSQKFGAEQYAKGLTSMILLESEGSAVFDDNARRQMVREFKKAYTGIDNAHTVGFMPPGVKANVLSADMDKAQYKETMDFVDLQICRLFRVPPAMVGIMGGATYSNTEQQSKAFYDSTLAPLVKKIEAELEEKLLLESEKATFIIRFNLDWFLRADVAARFNAYNLGRNMGIYSRNDIRRLENLSTLGEAGDDYLQPLNMTAVTIRNFKPLIDAAIRRISTKEYNAAKNKKDLEAWAAEYAPELRALATENFEPIAQAMTACGIKVTAEELTEEFVRKANSITAQDINAHISQRSNITDCIIERFGNE